MSSVRQGRGRDAYAKGIWSERLAALVLFLKGYRILAKRYRTPVGEIDLVARKGRTLVFVEVKARGTAAAGLEAVTRASQTRLARAAEHFAATRAECGGLDWRFDVIVVSRRRWPLHVRGAF